jgi:hypothetical protein
MSSLSQDLVKHTEGKSAFADSLAQRVKLLGTVHGALLRTRVKSRESVTTTSDEWEAGGATPSSLLVCHVV